jgi:hypothetical protein
MARHFFFDASSWYRLQALGRRQFYDNLPRQAASHILELKS